ncbi:MAG: sulfotransferase family 2 domain-containing protein [Gammaproteobacteria bacterium]
MSLPKVKIVYKKTCDTLYPKGIAFFHVPKCGGSSLSRVFRTRYFLSQIKIEESGVSYASNYLAQSQCVNRIPDEDLCTARQGAMQMLKRAMVAYYLSENVKFVQAHVHFDRRLYDSFQHTHRFITLLRDPVERFISQYYYDYGRQNGNCISNELDEFVDTPRGIETGQVFLDYFGEKHFRNLSDAQRVDRAKENLELFAVTGFLDDMVGFKLDIAQTLGIRLRIGHVNKGNSERKPIQDEIYKRIQQRCAADIEIYNYAKTLRLRTTNDNQILAGESYEVG